MIQQKKKNKENFQIPKDSKSEMMRRHLSQLFGYHSPLLQGFFSKQWMALEPFAGL